MCMSLLWYCVKSCYTVVVTCFLLFFSFSVRGSGLSTSFYVTSLYIDAALLGGARHTSMWMRAA